MTLPMPNECTINKNSVFMELTVNFDLQSNDETIHRIGSETMGSKNTDYSTELFIT
jgi:hypothetical protein